MENNNIDEKLINKIAQLKPVTPLTQEFIETLSGQLRLKILTLKEKKSRKVYQRWYFWSGMLVPVAILVLVVISSQDGFVYNQLPLISKVSSIEDNGFNDSLLKNKINLDFSEDYQVPEPVVSNDIKIENSPTLRSMKIAPIEGGGSGVSADNSEQGMVAGQMPQALIFSSEQTATMPSSVPVQKVLPKKETVKKFVLNSSLPDLPKTALVYKVSNNLTKEVINNLYKFMDVSQPLTDKLPDNNFTLIGEQTFGLIAKVDVGLGKISFSKNEPKWQIRFLRQIMRPKMINSDMAKATADEFIKGIGYGLDEVGYVETSKTDDDWQFIYYQRINGYDVEDVNGAREILAKIKVDSLLSKVSAAEINWLNYQASNYDLLIDQIELEKIIIVGGYNLNNSKYVNQVVGEGKVILLALDDLLVPSLVFRLGQDNLYLPLIEKIWK